MIGYWGYRGAGKTLNAVADLYERFNWDPNILILSNTPLFFPKHKKTGGELEWIRWWDMDEVVAYFQECMKYGDEVMKRPTYVLIDEASVTMNARFWKECDPAMLAFMFQSRHINVEIVFTTQHPSMVDANLRRITETWQHCEKMRFLGLFPTKWMSITEQELTPEGGIVEEHHTRRRFFVKRYWPMYRTDGVDSLVGVSRNVRKDVPNVRAEFIEAIHRAYGIEANKQISTTARPPVIGEANAGGQQSFSSKVNTDM